MTALGTFASTLLFTLTRPQSRELRSFELSVTSAPELTRGQGALQALRCVLSSLFMRKSRFATEPTVDRQITCYRVIQSLQHCATSRRLRGLWCRREMLVLLVLFTIPRAENQSREAAISAQFKAHLQMSINAVRRWWACFYRCRTYDWLCLEMLQ